VFKICILITVLFAASTGCQRPAKDETPLSLGRSDELLESVKDEYAPDKRVALFDIEAKAQDTILVLTGETDQPQAKQELLRQLTAENIAYVDSIRPLPDASLGKDTLGVVTISVANIRSQPKHSGELATQATMGTPLRLLKKEGDWHLVQTPDKYISWMQGSFVPMDTAAYAAWQAADKLIFTAPYGFTYQDETFNESVSDLVMGNVMALRGENRVAYWVAFPDGREGYVPKDEAVPYDEWVAQTEATEESLVSTAMQLTGVPYLWGGTSAKGVDCSGYTKTIYFMNGHVLPRDASQQVHAGELVDNAKNFDQLQPGDLLFFGRAATDSTRERVTHVGMWIGHDEFIHAPGLEAHVRVSSVDPEADNFDEPNLNRYLRSKRMINSRNEVVALREVKLF
jgi:cell wall-associated NlpC family hydrolase